MYRKGLFWISRGSAAFGATLTTLIIPFLLTVSLSLDPISVSLVMAGPMVMNLLSPLYAGVLADSFDRRKVVVWADFARVVVLGSLGALALMGDSISLYLLVALSSLHAGAAAISNTSFRAGFPDIVGEVDLHKANSHLQSIATVANSAGGLFGGGLVSVLGAPIAFAVNGLAVATSVLTLVPVPWPKSAPMDRTAMDGKRPSYLRRVGAGFSIVWRDRVLRALILTSTVSSVFLSLSGVALLWMLVRANGLDYFGYAVVLSVGSLGAVAGAFLSERITRWVGSPSRIQAISLVGYGVLLACYGFVYGNGWVVILVCSVIDFSIGFLLSIYVVNNAVQQQRIVSSENRGSASVVRSFGLGVAAATGTAASGALIALFGSHVVMLMCGAGVVAVALAFGWWVLRVNVPLDAESVLVK